MKMWVSICRCFKFCWLKRNFHSSHLSSSRPPFLFICLLFFYLTFLTSYSSESQAFSSRHRHHHGENRSNTLVKSIRTKRQHGGYPSHYGYHDEESRRQDTYPESYVLDEQGQTEEESGPWEEWSRPTECSRSCGGGVSTQERQCRDRRPDGTSSCTGASARYFSCNIHDCPPGAGDFRAEQCSQFNELPFEGRKYEWIPYTKAPNKCELNCMPRGERFYYRHKRKVTDGTRCDDEKHDICVDGRCQPVGCDMKLGSTAREDKCRSCGGDGSNCNTITGLFDQNNMQVGYNDILLIPAGATNINVRESRPSNNYLAIRNVTGHYYLNGNWRIDFPSEMTFAGTIFHYERKPHSFLLAPESIRALGPITEALYIVILYQESNPGIIYEYSIPKGVVISETEEYTWVYGDFSECSEACGGGHRTRTVNCARRSTMQAVDHHLCDPTNKPETRESCNNEACPTRWYIGSWEDCDAPCGGNGTQLRQVFCEQTVSGVSAIVQDSRCSEDPAQGPKPERRQDCQGGTECPTWFVGDWLPCDHLCGPGHQKRVVKCHTHEEGKVIIHEDSKCSGEKPEESLDCFNHPCEGVDWVTSPWSGCEENCGSTQETREVHCSTAQGEVYADEHCHSYRKPNATRECEQLKACEYSWYAAQWTKCSSSCGPGLQTRRVFCGETKDDGSIAKADDSKCEAESKYEDSKNCTVATEECKGTWSVGPWSKCSKPCGGGSQNRTLLCMLGEKTVPVSNCDQEKILALPKREDCNTHACGADEIMTVMPSHTAPEGDECESEELDATQPMEMGTTSSDLLFTTGIFGTSDDEASGEGSAASELTTALFGSTLMGETGSTDLEADTGKSTTEFMGTDDISASPSYSSSSSGETMIASSTESVTESETSMFSSLSSEPSMMISTTSVDSSSPSSMAVSVSESMGSTSSDMTTEGGSVGPSDSTSSDSMSSSTGATGLTSSSTDGSTASDGSTVSSDVSGGSTGSTIVGSTDGGSSPSMTSPSGESTSSPSMDSSAPTATTESSSSTSESSSESSSSSSESSSSSSTEDTTTETTVEMSSTTQSSISSSTGMDTTMGGSSLSTGSEDSTVGITTDGSSSATATTGATATSGAAMSQETTTDDAYDIEGPGSLNVTIGWLESVTDEDEHTTTTPDDDESSSSPIPSGSTLTDLMDSSTDAMTGGSTESSAATETATGGSTVTGDASSSLDTSSSAYASTSESDLSSSAASSSSGVSDSMTLIDETTVSVSDDMSTGGLGSGESTTEVGSGFDDLFGSSTTEPGTTVDGAISEEMKVTKCKPREAQKVNCTTTPFGCCPNGIDVALGPFGFGCVSFKTCKETKFGCCPDGVSVSPNKKGKGCPEPPCERTLFGCCPDGKHAARGNDNEGCEEQKETCEDSEHGCCPDGETFATGPKNRGCDEKVDINCAVSKFGCCPGGKTAAKGDNYKGCKEINLSNCTASFFGCCSDSKTAALGTNMEGCPEACATETYGCCPDGKTSAHGPNKEGCCLNTRFGCCPDNIVAAQGQRFEGCGCQYSPHGCCPDNETAARGPGMDGCGCRFTEHGCCPDGYTDAPAPNYEGCPCQSFQFGCCPDGVTVAKGPNKEACGCQYSEFGCCPDQRTPSSGPNRESCGCESSRFGCCPDGTTEASGKDFEGCEEVPIKPGDVCGLDKERGSCRNFTVKWFFDMEYGGCSRFWYGGCDGNNNRFSTQDECKAVCVEPEGRDACYLPRVAGPCEGYYPSWYYDPQRERCEQFIYGGCLGNNNRYTAREQCENTCLLPDRVDACDQPKTEGPCRGNVTRVFFDKDSGSCQTFQYGGCKGNNNNFLTEKECHQRCKEEGRVRAKLEQCSFPRDAGLCKGDLVRWYYDENIKTCLRFLFGGCGGNPNRFVSRQECLTICARMDPDIPVVTPKNMTNQVCFLPKVEGPCGEKLPRWHYDSNEQRCLPFYYSGCQGNANRFPNLDECERTCPKALLAENACIMPPSIGDCTSYTERYHYDAYTSQCKAFVYSGCGGNANNFLNVDECRNKCERSYAPKPQPVFNEQHCFMGPDQGTCDENLVKWYYDSRDGVCRQFRYGGCDGNMNRFDGREECEDKCSLSQDICQLPQVVGPCSGSFQQWYYDTESDTCNLFEFGGCQGNGNRFDTQVQCEQRCKKDLTSPDVHPEVPEEEYGPPYQPESPHQPEAPYEPERPDTDHHYPDHPHRPEEVEAETTTLAPPYHPPDYHEYDICRLNVEPGRCRDNRESVSAWYYDTSSGKCTAFTFSGCEGNANRFETEEQCERQCGQFKGQDVCRLSADIGPCRGRFPKWFFDPADQSCRQFYYGGCHGNGNRFSTQEECESICFARTEILPSNDTISGSEICRLPVDIGPCHDGYKRFYYEPDRKTCIPFAYGGCAGNLNRFKSFDICLSFCSQFLSREGRHPQPNNQYSPPEQQRPEERERRPEEPTQEGQSPPERENEEDDRDRDHERERQERERERERQERERERQEREREREREREHDPDHQNGHHYGPDRERDHEREREHDPNQNGHHSGPDHDRHPDEHHPTERSDPENGGHHTEEEDPRAPERGPERDCSREDYECEVVRCPYGVERYVSEGGAGCTVCRCVDPCRDESCPEGTQCSVDVHNAPYGSANGPIFRAICRRVNKPGTCPNLAPSRAGNCDQECQSDADCSADMKCCFNGCGSSCLVPIHLETNGLTDRERPVAVGEPAIIVGGEQNVEAEEGSLAALECIARGQPEPSISWRRGSEKISTDAGRFRMLPDGTLQIIGVWKSDSGTYTCIADNGVGRPAQQNVKLNVTEPTSRQAVVVEDSPELIVSLGTSASLRCFAVGWPRPSVTWWRGDRMLPFSSERYEQMRDYSLLIRLVSLRDLGPYTCQAYNGLGKAASWTITLQAVGPVHTTHPDDQQYLRFLVSQPKAPAVPVRPRPPPRVPPTLAPVITFPPTTRPTTTTTTTHHVVDENEIVIPNYLVPLRTTINLEKTVFSVGSEVSIPCEVEGYPTPQVLWYHEEDSVPGADPRARVLEDHTLVISNATTSDTGTYRCDAVNEYGSASTSVTIQVEGVYLHPNCTDNPFFANCKLIVKASYCTNRYYARFCCKSCTLAGQLPAYGPHLQEYGQAYFRRPPTSYVTRRRPEREQQRE